jgi:hypothetical protein
MDSSKETAPVAKEQEPNDQELAVFVQNLLEQMVIYLILLSSLSLSLTLYV